MNNINNIIVGLDLGSSFVRTVIGEVLEGGKIEIIGVAQKPSFGLRNGVIVNRDSVMDCIKKSIEEAEQEAGYEVTSCYAAIGGVQIESTNNKGLVAISSHGKSPREITDDDIKKVMECANAIQIPEDKLLLHSIPQNFKIDGTVDCRTPLGNIAVRLEAEVHTVLASKTVVANIVECIERLGCEIDGIMLKTLAAANAVMLQDERELGSVLIDLGGGTTDVTVINNDAPICNVSVPVGGNLVTNDIAIVRGIPLATAEKIKLDYGCCWADALEEDCEIVIPGAGGREPEVCRRSEICFGIIEPRMREIFSLVREEIVNKVNSTLDGNIILTGGGALMPGVVQLAQDVFGTCAVRIGFPGDLGGLQEKYRRPDFATVVGLVTGSSGSHIFSRKPVKRSIKSEKSDGVLNKMWNFIKKNCF